MEDEEDDVIGTGALVLEGEEEEGEEDGAGAALLDRFLGAGGDSGGNTALSRLALTAPDAYASIS